MHHLVKRGWQLQDIPVEDQAAHRLVEPDGRPLRRTLTIVLGDAEDLLVGASVPVTLVNALDARTDSCH